MKLVANYRRSLKGVEARAKEEETIQRTLAASIGKALKTARLQRGLKLKHVAQRTGMSISKLHEIENGIGKLVDCETFDRLVEAIEQEAA